MIRALIFDFDGLILDTEVPIFQSWQELYQSYRVDLPLDRWQSILGTDVVSFDPLAYLEEQVGYRLDHATIKPLRRQREWELILIQPVQPGVLAYLQDARRLGLKIGLASSSPCEWVTGHLQRLGLLGYFDCLRGSDDVSKTKPDPELYLAALKALNVQSDQAIVFEDSLNGILAAKRAGIYTVAVPSPLMRGVNLDLADQKLSSLTDLSLEQLLQHVDRRG
jgi:HAD superfamily hydrolase (TIGR01509 family)